MPRNWGKTASGDGYKYTTTITIDGVQTHPKAIVYQWGQGTGDFIAEIYFPDPGAEEYSESINSYGEADHYASTADSFQEAMDRVVEFVEKHNSAEEIRDAVNAPIR